MHRASPGPPPPDGRSPVVRRRRDRVAALPGGVPRLTGAGRSRDRPTGRAGVRPPSSDGWTGGPARLRPAYRGHAARGEGGRALTGDSPGRWTGRPIRRTSQGPYGEDEGPRGHDAPPACTRVPVRPTRRTSRPTRHGEPSRRAGGATQWGNHRAVHERPVRPGQGVHPGQATRRTVTQDRAHGLAGGPPGRTRASGTPRPGRTPRPRHTANRHAEPGAQPSGATTGPHTSIRYAPTRAYAPAHATRQTVTQSRGHGPAGGPPGHTRASGTPRPGRTPRPRHTANRHAGPGAQPSGATTGPHTNTRHAPGQGVRHTAGRPADTRGGPRPGHRRPASAP
ncbi:hypothetical protein FHS36_002194 [Streptomyces eurocidicus]|uniref:Uncharacterized protein n=1 Tax=Streptomyces eurocidicus TaxID=66423 RepID=A0A7W8B8J5_STREU|nr:hypothetical protein [Streptomyces eurocidicus]